MAKLRMGRDPMHARLITVFPALYCREATGYRGGLEGHSEP